MRCARCDEIIFRQVLGRMTDGRLAFGWCEACLVDTGCEVIDPSTAGLLSPRTLGVKVRKRPRTRTQAVWRSLALAWLGGAGLLAAWGVMLAYVGGWKLASPVPAGDHAVDPFGASSTVSLIGSVLLAALSLVGWSLVLGRGGNRRFLLRCLQVGATLSAFATLGWGILRHEPRRDPWIVSLVAASLAVAVAARQLEKRAERAPRLVPVLRGAVRQHGRIR